MNSNPSQPEWRNRVPVIVSFLLATLILSGCSLVHRKARILARADEYFQQGDYDRAKIEYMNLLRADQQNVRAYQQIGVMWSEEGVPLRALPFLLKAKELDPRNVMARAKLGLDLMRLGGVAEARKEAFAVLEQDPGNADAILLLADTSVSKEDIGATSQQLAKFPQKNSAAFHLASAALALRKGETAAATDLIQQAASAEPKSARAHLALAYAFLSARNSKRAGEELKTAADLSPLRSAERIKYAEFLASTGSINDAKVALQDLSKRAPDFLPAWQALAQIAFAEKKYDDALSLLENIFGRDGNNPDARVLESNIWLAKGDAKRAVTILDRLNAAYPKAPLLKYQLALAYLKSNNAAQAATALQEAITVKPDFNQAILALAELNLRTGKFKVAAAALEDLLKKQPGLLQARILLGDAYQAMGQWNNAEAVFRDQIKINPEGPDLYFLLGQVTQREGKLDEARKAFEKAAELAPFNINPVDKLVDLDIAEKHFDAATERVRRFLQKSPGAGAQVMQAKVLAAEGKFTEAEVALKKAIELDVNFAPAYNALVSVYLAERKLPDALNQLDQSLKKNPKNPGALLVMGLINEQMKNYPQARDAYEKVLTLNAEVVPALNNLAYLYAEALPQLDRAYDLAQKAHALDPANAMVTDTLGWILFKRGDYRQALPLLQESAGKAPDNPEIQFHLGMTSSMMGQGEVARAAFERAAQSAADFPDKDEAKRRLALLAEPSGQQPELSVEQLEASLKQQPNDVIVLNRLGDAYEKRGDAAKAATAYEHALKVNPNLPGVFLKLAQLYGGPLHANDKALEFAKKARAQAPNDAEVAGVLGRIAFQTGNFDWAYGLLQQSARQHGDDAEILHDLGMTAYALGKVSEARAAIQRCLDAAPAGPRAAEAKRFLALTALDRSTVLAAAAQVQEILKAQPDYAPALMAEAAIFSQQNNVKAATEIYQRVLKQYPDFAPAQENLAAIYAENPDNLSSAYELAMKARKALPSDPEVARTLAEISFRRSEFPYAIQLFLESAGKEPLPAQDLYYLGMAQLQARQDAKGRETLTRALASGLQDPLAQEAKRRMAEPAPK